MNWMQDKVREFHLALGQPAPEVLSPDGFRAELRARLILEEALETVEALGFRVEVSSRYGVSQIGLTQVSAPDWPEVVDGLCDLTYVTLGAAVEAGFSLAPFFHEVHRSNMTKVGGPVRESDGKVLKPDAFEPPRIAYLWRRVVERASGALAGAVRGGEGATPALPHVAGVPSDEEIAHRIARRLRSLRRSAGLTQAEVALRTGMNRPNVARLEALRPGAHVPRIDTVLRYVAATGHPPSAVLSCLESSAGADGV